MISPFSFANPGYTTASTQLPAPLLDYQASSLTTSSVSAWPNLGTLGAAFDLVLAGSTPGILLPTAGPKASPSVQLDPGVALQTSANLPISGAAERTMFLQYTCRTPITMDLMGWGGQDFGRMFNFVQNQGGIQLHYWGASYLLNAPVADTHYGLLVRFQAIGGNGVLRGEVTRSPETSYDGRSGAPLLLDTYPTPLALGGGNAFGRGGRIDVQRFTFWDHCFDNAQTQKFQTDLQVATGLRLGYNDLKA